MACANHDFIEKVAFGAMHGYHYMPNKVINACYGGFKTHICIQPQLPSFTKEDVKLALTIIPEPS